MIAFIILSPRLDPFKINMDKLQKKFIETIKSASGESGIRDLVQKRIESGFLSKSDNEFYHFCVYFPAYDQKKKLLFIGHHKKSGLWLANGGHVEKNESPKQALKREISEEWGIDMDVENLSPSLLTITEIESNPAKRLCKAHCDIWFFVPQDNEKFAPDKKLLSKEFYESGWKTFAEARLLSKDINTITGISEIEKLT